MSAAEEALPGFERVERGGEVALVKSAYADVLLDLFFGQGAAEEVTRRTGRGAVYIFDLPDGKGVLRRYRRGGMLARLRKDRFWRSNRPLKELVVLEYARQSRLPVPEVLGVLWERHGQRFSGAIATRLVPGVTLQDWAGAHAAEEEAAVLLRCGESIRRMHDAGVYHADLQIRNIVVGDGRVHLIDFDRARRLERLTGIQRAQNLLRLRRSIEKNRLPSRYFAAILDGYGDVRLPGPLRAAYRVKGLLSDAMQRRRN